MGCAEVPCGDLGAPANGAIAPIHSKEIKTFDDPFAEYLRNNSLIAAAKKADVAALLLQPTRPRGLIYRHPISWPPRAHLDSWDLGNGVNVALVLNIAPGCKELGLVPRGTISKSYSPR